MRFKFGTAWWQSELSNRRYWGFYGHDEQLLWSWLSRERKLGSWPCKLELEDVWPIKAQLCFLFTEFDEKILHLDLTIKAAILKPYLESERSIFKGFWGFDTQINSSAMTKFAFFKGSNGLRLHQSLVLTWNWRKCFNAPIFSLILDIPFIVSSIVGIL